MGLQELEFKLNEMTLEELHKVNLHCIDDKFYYGKYKGEPLLTIIESNPLYVLWCSRNIDSFYISEDVFDALAKHLFKIPSIKVKGSFEALCRKLESEGVIGYNPEEFYAILENCIEDIMEEEMRTDILDRSSYMCEEDITGGSMDFDTWFEIK